jgi:hypothetical protein
VQSGLISIRKSRPTSGFSRIATARFFKRFLLAELVYNVACLACPQSAEPQALGRSLKSTNFTNSAIIHPNSVL